MSTETKDRIIQAASELFMRNGIRSVSMDDIATHLAMSKKTLYKWFENKDQIVLATMQQHLEREESCSQQAPTAANALEEMFHLMQWHRQMIAELHPSIFYDLQKYHPQAWSLFTEHKNTFVLRKVAEGLRRGMAEGVFRPDLDVEVLSRLRLAEIDLCFDNNVFPHRQFELQHLHITCLEHFLLGIASLKGHKLINQYRQVTEEE